MAFKNTRDTVLSEINVTPLVDVMLVLLIIFMVTAPLIQHGVKIDLPQTKAGNMPRKNRDLVVVIDRERTVYLLDEQYTLEEFEVKLRAMSKIKEEKTIYLAADRTLPYDAVIKLMAVVKNAGFEALGLITDPELIDQHVRDQH